MRYWDKLAKLKAGGQNGKESITVSIMAIPGQQTGAGPDGIVQPDKPAAVDMSSGAPVILHEGENVQQRPDGSRQVIPATQNLPNLHMITDGRTQEVMRAIEKSGRVPGMQTGGIINPYDNQQGAQNAPAPTMAPAAPAPAPTTTAPAPTITQPAATAAAPAPTTTTPAPTITAPATTTPAPVIAPADQIQQSIQTLGGIASGDSPLYDKLSSQYLGQLGASQAAKQQAQAQSMAQAGLSQESKNVLEQVADRDASMQQGQVAGDLATQQAKQAQAAAEQAAGLAAKQQMFEHTKAQEQIQSLLNMGGTENIANAEQLFSSVYGMDIDFGKADLPNIQMAMDNITQWLNDYGANADPAAVESMAKQYGALWKQKNAAIGVSIPEEQYGQIIEQLQSGNISPENSEVIAGISSSMNDWWNDGDGSALQMLLSPEYQSLQNDATDPNLSQAQREAAAKKLGQIVGIAYYADSGYNITDDQKAQLKAAGLGMLVAGGYDDPEKVAAEETANLVDEFISGGRTDWSSLIGNSKAVQQIGQKAIQGMGSSSSSGKGKGKDRRRYWSNLEVAYDDGTPIVIDGTVYIVKDRTTKNEWGIDETQYTLMNLSTGKTKSVVTKPSDT